MFTYMAGAVSVQMLKTPEGHYSFSCPLFGISGLHIGADTDSHAKFLACELCISKAAELINIFREAQNKIVA